MLAGAAAGTVVQWVLTDFRPRLRLNWEEARSMLGYGGGAVGLEVVAIIATRMDQIVIGRVVNEAALGLYSVAFRIPELLIDTLTWNVSLVAFPAMSRERVRGREGVGSATLKLVRYQGLFALPTAAALAVTAPQLVIVVFGDQWAAAGPVMSAVAFVSAITAVIFPLGDVFKALGRQRILMTLGLIEIPISLAAMIIAAPKGIELVAWVRVATIAVHSVAVVYFVARLARFGPADFLRALRPGVVTGLATAAGAAVVRVLLPSPELIPVLLELLAAGVCGVVALRFVAPDVIAQALALAPALSRRSAPGGAAS
jgi:PST family polysaccharide transporter